MAAVTVAGVPTSISRVDRDLMIESLGFEVDDVVEIVFEVGAITATVIARDAQGRPYAAGDEIAMHHISIPLEG